MDRTGLLQFLNGQKLVNESNVPGNFRIEFGEATAGFARAYSKSAASVIRDLNHYYGTNNPITNNLITLILLPPQIIRHPMDHIDHRTAKIL